MLNSKATLCVPENFAQLGLIFYFKTTDKQALNPSPTVVFTDSYLAQDTTHKNHQNFK